MANVDLLIALGTRLDTRQTGAKIDGFMPNGKIIHVDIDNSELECHRIENRIKLNMDVADYLLAMEMENLEFSIDENWYIWLKNTKLK